jgi:signal transduction histidine kinase
VFFLRDGTFHRLAQSEGLSDTAILAIAEDREKNVWVGTRAGGLNRLKARQVFVWCHVENGVEVPPMSLAEAPDGRLWVATFGHGLYRLDTHGDRWAVGEPLAGRLSFGTLSTSRDGSVWLGAAAQLVQWRNGTLVGSYSSAPEVRSDSVRCLWEDRDDGMWLGTRDGRLFLLRKGNFTRFTNNLPGGMFTALTQQPDGTVWIGSYGGGLGRLQNGVGTTFGRKQGLSGDLVRALFLDSKEHLWIGTEGGGLNCFKDGVIRSLGPQHGLGDDTVVQILEDNAGDLWLGTYRGIFRLVRREVEELLAGRVARVHPRRFDRSDGLRSEQCATSFGAALKSADGRLFFSTDRGLVVIDPKRVSDRPTPSIVRLEYLVAGGQSWRIEQGFVLGTNSVPVAELKLPQRQRIELQYTALYFAAPERVRFRHRLLGLESEWFEAGDQRTARYSYLPPGRYRFEVGAHNGDGQWGESTTSLTLRVLPHFWQTWWFQLAVCLGAVTLASGGGVAVQRRRLRLRMQALERQRAIERERSRIAQDMHDELGSRLTKAGMVAERVARELGDAPEPQQRVRMLRQTLGEMTITMDELVWAVDPQHDTLNGLANYLIRFTQEFFSGTAIRCELSIPHDLPAVPLTAAVRHNLFLAFKEALNNAAKHAAPTVVKVRVAFVAGRLQMEVADDGPGFAPAGKRPGGRGLEIMRDRLQAIGGRCDVESNEGRGTQVRFDVPLPASA